MWKLEYSYDGVYIGDLFPISSGFTQSIQRNGVGQIQFSVSLRALASFCESKSFDVTRMFTPIKSSIKTVQTGASTSGESMGGWLSARPSFSLGASADTMVQFMFTGWLGLCAGAFILPPYSYSGNFNTLAAYQIARMIERTTIAGAPWPITSGTSDTLPSVTGTIDAPKTLKDFLLERADNQTGTGTFDVYADPSGKITLYTKYGFDISADSVFNYPDIGNKYDLRDIGFAQWDGFVSDMFLTGAGNGYESTSGSEGAAIFSEARNSDTITNIGYWQHAASESDISTQTELDSKATSYVFNTDKPFDMPTLKVDGDRFNLYAHDLGGDLWLGDVISVSVNGWAKPLLPIVTPIVLRINQIDMAIDRLGHCDLSLGMVADV
jgi:hypothetical protein